MRKIKELLELLLKEIEENETLMFGLCFEVYTLWKRNKDITSSEETRIRNYITKNIPVYSEDEEYGWEPGLLEPRIKWLKKEIKKH